MCIRKSRLPRSKVDLDRDISVMFSRFPLALKLCLNFNRHSSDTSFGELVLSNLIAWPSTKLCFTPGGWHVAKCVN